MHPNRALLGTGAFTRITDTRRQREEILVESLGLASRVIVLEIGWGHGTLAIPAARPGADVTGVDIPRSTRSLTMKSAGDTLVGRWGAMPLRFSQPRIHAEAVAPFSQVGWFHSANS